MYIIIKVNEMISSTSSTLPAIFLFHRDLRTVDNTGLNALIRVDNAQPIFLIFIIDPIQVDPSINQYFSNPAVQFMCESIEEIDKINVLYGDTMQVLEHLHNVLKYTRLYQNEDISLFATERDKKIADFCIKTGIDFKNISNDYYLYQDIEKILGKTYMIFRPFFNRILKLGSEAINRPFTVVDSRKRFKYLPNSFGTTSRRRSALRTYLMQFYHEKYNLVQRGGRKNGMEMLQNIKHISTRYGQTRDIMADVHGTTRASAHLKFGTVSVREYFWACIDAFGTMNHPLVRELMFREFYAQIYSKRPELQRGCAFDSILDKKIPWSYSKKLFSAWASGQTGIPLVDAGMRELEKTGWMHNRARMIVGNFATKHCLLDWRECARYFYTNLVDCDIFSNTAGWGFVSSTGVDPQPWYRYPMNPFLQSRKFDPHAEYIKRYVPELKEVDATDLHRWNDDGVRKKYRNKIGHYPEPIIDVALTSKRAKLLFTRNSP